MSESKGGPVAVTGIELGSGREALLRECGRALLGILFGEPDAQQRVAEIDRKLARPRHPRQRLLFWLWGMSRAAFGAS